MSVNMKSFLEKGVLTYSEAQSTIAVFEAEMEKMVMSVVKGRPNWRPLKPPEISEWLPRGSREDGWRVSAWIEGRSSRGQKVAIDCGLWWSAPEVRRSVIYARFYDAPKDARKFKLDEGKHGICSLRLWGSTFLYLPLVAKPLNLKKPLNRLLDELLKRLA
jgi:hypothetical protein